jgi:outer membrane receptor protein involved in Fe transport
VPQTLPPRHAFRKTLPALAAVAALSALPALKAGAQTAPAPQPASTPVVVITGEIAYRDRTPAIAPTLTYGQDYFQRFEPSTAGDMVKRVPSATFVSDVLEFDAVQLRGLAPAYTQVLVNGKQVPGGADDRSFWLDRIPAEMVERVEVLRSASANRSGDAMAGAINIVLRDAYKFDGSYIRAGVTRYDDGKLKPTVGLVTSGEALGGRVLVSLNVQDRYNPKLKRSDRFDEPGGELVSFEDQSDTRDGRDYSGTLSYTAGLGPGRFRLDGFVVKTDRKQKEVSRETEFDDGDTVRNNVPGLALVKQTNWGISTEYSLNMAGGKTTLGLEHARFKDDNLESEESFSYVNGSWDSSEGEKTGFDSQDKESGLRLAHKRGLGSADMEFGLQLRSKNRLTRYTEFTWEGATESDPVAYEEDGVIQSRIKERRADPYLMFSGRTGALEWEAGLRQESTKATIESPSGTVDNRYNTALPSLNLKYEIGNTRRLNLSLAKTVRRPAFNELIPELLDGEYGDNDYIGNARLKPETATGIDLGFEQRLGRRGVVGVNVFYRNVKNLIELVNTGTPSEAAVEDWEDEVQGYMDDNGVSQDVAEDAVPFDPASFLYTSRNVGKGRVWGVELDLSTPLTALGLPDTGVFFNYSWLNSSVTDFMGKRRFNNQARSLYNIGFIHNLPRWESSFGASYRKQGEARSRVLGEEVITTYGGDLELFVEKRVGKNFAVRLSAANVLNAKKKEVFHKFDTLADQLDRDYDEYEVESEKAGPRVQLVARWAF